VKDLAHHFKTRIDLRQIGARDESKRLGGIGLCGRELCCSTWIREFQPVTTSMVKEQNILLNPQKNTGLCGRLRCCLRYEVHQYREVNALFPRPETKVTGPRGDGVVEKIDMCTESCGITWKDGARISFTLEQMKKFSDWDETMTEGKTIVTFHSDPSLEEEKNGQLVASEEYDEMEPMPIPAMLRNGVKPGGKRKETSHNNEAVGRKRLARPPKQSGSKRPNQSQRVEIVEAVPASEILDAGTELYQPKRPKRPGSGKKSRAGRSGSQNRDAKPADAPGKPGRKGPARTGTSGTSREEQGAKRQRPPRPRQQKTQQAEKKTGGSTEQKKPTRTGRKRKR